ncbi:hypothetical protein Ciccas_000636 [Cichlidogyrus casuarinus]|uniref:Trimethylguanosine synthase n=1 Tax=Cichlidogyrus casuarinus TaxID=1844966 RepID=A0ABD2QME1_9PLAT
MIYDTLSDVSTDIEESSIEDKVDEQHLEQNDAIEELTTCEKRKEKKRRYKENRRKRLATNPELGGDATMQKWWTRRYDLFWKFDEGIELDKESWFSVTPETIARRQAEVCSCDVLLDAFCGVGGNSVHFPQTCAFVLCIDLGFEKLEKLRHNSEIYACSNKIDCIQADVLTLFKCLRPGTVDITYMSPPWGGPGYTGVQLPPGSSSWNTKKRRRWFLEQESIKNAPIEEPYNLERIPCLKPCLEGARSITNRIACYLPRNCSIGQLLQLGWPITSPDANEVIHKSSSMSVNSPVKIEDYWLRGRRIALTAYLGDFPMLNRPKSPENPIATSPNPGDS